MKYKQMLKKIPRGSMRGTPEEAPIGYAQNGEPIYAKKVKTIPLDVGTLSKPQPPNPLTEEEPKAKNLDISEKENEGKEGNHGQKNNSKA